MVMDHIDNRENYFGLGLGIERALRYLAVTDFSEIAAGRYDIDGDEIYAIVDEYEPREASSCHLEAHKRYVDVQFIASGNERLGWAVSGDQTVVQPYSEESDLAFYDGDETTVSLEKDQFAIFFPSDLHKPGLKYRDNSIKKVVVKIALSHLQ